MARNLSITASASFQARLMRAERWRLALMAACFSILLILWEARRLLHGEVASAEGVHLPVVLIMLAGIGLLTFGWFDVTRRIRRGGSLPWARLIAGASIDLGVPFGVMLVMHLHSPLGGYAALSAPILLVVPTVIMLSVLRLRPLFSLATGVSAAVLHWALVVHTLTLHQAPAHTAPLLMSYGVLLLISGAAAATLSLFVRRYITEAVQEAEAAQRSSLALHTVEKELDIARDIQMGLLPTSAPELEAYDIAAMSRPAAKAGGDYYDWQALPDGRLIVVIADVTGHGIGPALGMAVCLSLFPI
ncbi:MAG: SpoIIE family protein phosphatase [Phycisphaerales bacterium]|nr:SpoIIE family protein phosphatase [Phycisphaerales bacterium]